MARGSLGGKLGMDGGRSVGRAIVDVAFINGNWRWQDPFKGVAFCLFGTFVL